MRSFSMRFYLFIILFSTLSSMCKGSPEGDGGGTYSSFTPDSVYRIMKKVADWQIDSIRKNGFKHFERRWTNAALYTGLLATADITGDEAYCLFIKEKVGEKNDWQLFSNHARYHADYYCVGQTYCQLYEIYKDTQMIADLRLLADTLIARPHIESLEWKNDIIWREWAWCDALFMGPPSLAMLAKATGEIKYMDICKKLWWKTTDYLYDPEENLFFRDSRFFNKTEKNGEKVFWSRGNGWVMGGLVRVLENIPEDYPDRNKWIQLYSEMAAKIASIQQPDGTWHASLLDPDSYPSKETSGTSFFCYALTWGINQGILDAKTYVPVVWKAWETLVSCVHPEGKLGYVQRIGDSPNSVSFDDTEVYGVGAFLLAGSELYKYKKKRMENYSSH